MSFQQEVLPKKSIQVAALALLLLALLSVMVSEQRQTRSTLGRIKGGGIFQEKAIRETKRTGLSFSTDSDAFPFPKTNSESVKPTFVLHVGPGKTATSTIQRDLARLTDVLAQDNFVNVGRHRNRTHRGSVIQFAITSRKCLEPTGIALASNQHPNTVACWDRAINEIQKWRSSNTSVIISDETISNTESPLSNSSLFNVSVTALKQALGNDWNVVVVIGYRRYSEWILSSLKQLHGIGCASERTDWTRGFCPSPWERIGEWMRRDPPSAKNFFYVNSVIDKWKEVFPIKILNYHAPGHVTQKFVCEIITNAPHTCEHTSTRSVHADSNVRTSSTGVYSNIALKAYRKRLLPRSAQRRQIIEEMEQYLDREVGLSYRHLPLRDCPPRDELEMLLNISLNFERELMPQWYQTPGGEEAHCESFWRIVDEKKEFCSVDMDAIFANKTSWGDVLRSLAGEVA